MTPTDAVEAGNEVASPVNSFVRTPERPASKLSENVRTSLPSGVTAPTPVIQTALPCSGSLLLLHWFAGNKLDVATQLNGSVRHLLPPFRLPHRPTRRPSFIRAQVRPVGLIRRPARSPPVPGDKCQHRSAADGRRHAPPCPSGIGSRSHSVSTSHIPGTRAAAKVSTASSPSAVDSDLPQFRSSVRACPRPR